ncbi:hypothetical protein QSG17_24740, partial [Escherichia coli]|uniref:hypothetical protein n=1 Tax=Escherichia coli TaxID=562 RepID=UPI002739D688
TRDVWTYNVLFEDMLKQIAYQQYLEDLKKSYLEGRGFKKEEIEEDEKDQEAYKEILIYKSENY